MAKNIPSRVSLGRYVGMLSSILKSHVKMTLIVTEGMHAGQGQYQVGVGGAVPGWS